MHDHIQQAYHCHAYKFQNLVKKFIKYEHPNDLTYDLILVAHIFNIKSGSDVYPVQFKQDLSDIPARKAITSLGCQDI